MKATEQIEFKELNKLMDRLKEFDAKHGWIDYFIAPVLVTIILLIVYAIKGVYPFGINTIAYYDMPTNGLASFAWLCDFFHGKVGTYLNWNIGMGASNAAGANEFIPTNWFFMFVNRDNILYAASIFLIFKLELSAFTMSFYIKKKYGSTVITISAGILYVFSGYVLQYYTNIDFLDYSMMLPFIIYALERLLIEYKTVPFTVSMIFMYICSIQLAFMLCIYLVFKSYFILKEIPEENKAKSIRLFILSAIISAFLASFVLLPTLLTLVPSVRVTKGATGEGSDFEYFEQMRFVYNAFRRHKQFMVYGGEMAVGLFFYLIIKGKNTFKKYVDNIAMIIIVGLPIIHEGINLLWHMGSYKHFPVRFGYMLTFECLVFIAKFWCEDDFIKTKYIGRIARLVGTAAIPFVAYVLYKFFDEFTESGIGDMSPYHTYWLYLLTLSGMYFIIFLMDSVQARKNELIIVALIQGFCGCYGLIAPKSANIEHFRIRYALNSIELKKEFGETGIRTNRIKMNPEDYDPNDSIIADLPTISYWSYGINSHTEEELQRNMEYDGMPTCTLDSGGTVFTDALLGVKYVASIKEPDNVLYTKDETKKNIYLCNYSMPFGIVLSEAEIDDESVGFKYHNKLFNKITNGHDDLISVIPAEDFVVCKKVMSDNEFNKIIDIFIENGPKDAYGMSNSAEESLEKMNSDVENDTVVVEDSSNAEDESTRRFDLSIITKDRIAVYLRSDEAFDNEMLIMVDKKPLYTSSFESYGQFYYPNAIRNGIYALGSIDNSKMELSIHTTNKDLKGIEIGLLNLDVLEKGIENVKKNQDLTVKCGKSDMHVTGKVNKAGTLFFPMGYSDNWHAKLNGKRVNIRPYINGAFISVDVPKGDIDIEFSYLPKGLVTGIALSVLGLIMGVILIVFEKHGGLAGKKCEPIIDKMFIYGYYTIVAVLFAVMYVVPIWIKMSL